MRSCGSPVYHEDTETGVIKVGSLVIKSGPVGVGSFSCAITVPTRVPLCCGSYSGQGTRGPSANTFVRRKRNVSRVRLHVCVS